MLKKILIGVGIAILAFVLYFVYVAFIAPPASPRDTASLSNQGVEVSVDYSRPFKKDRVIFGTEESGALQPYGNYWRLGANSATEITINKDVNFAGEPLKAGTYRMYAIPGKTAFEIKLNSELDVFFGVSEADASLDVLSVQAPVIPRNEVLEQFTISFSPIDGGVLMNFDWDNVNWSVPIISQ
jgi:hypothetical protein